MIESLTVKVHLSGIPQDQQRRSDQAVLDLVRYFTAPWPARRRWATLVMEEAHTTRAETSMTFDAIILSSSYLQPAEGELLLIDIRRK